MKFLLQAAGIVNLIPRHLIPRHIILLTCRGHDAARILGFLGAAIEEKKEKFSLVRSKETVTDSFAGIGLPLNLTCSRREKEQLSRHVLKRELLRAESNLGFVRKPQAILSPSGNVQGENPSNQEFAL